MSGFAYRRNIRANTDRMKHDIACALRIPRDDIITWTTVVSYRDKKGGIGTKVFAPMGISPQASVRLLHRGMSMIRNMIHEQN